MDEGGGLNHFRRWLVAACIALLCGGCSGGAGPDPARRDAARGSEAKAQQELTPQQAAAAYAALAANPGVAGVDYDPRVILVDYRDGALPPLAPGLGSASGLAAREPNAQLRRNRQYEAFSDAIAARYGLSIRQQVYYGRVNIASFNVPPAGDPAAVLARLRSEFAAQIVGAVFSPRRQLCYTPNDPDYTTGSYGKLWDRWRIRCGSAWDYTLGDPQVLIAVADTGVRRTHEELSAQVINTQVEFPSAYCDVLNHDKDPNDDYGHGTFIAGIIAAQADNARTLVGAAPHCRVLPIKIGDGTGADLADEVAGCVLAMDLGARVVNVSFGGYQYAPAEQDMVNELAAGGVFFAAAAGNEATDQSSYPASFTNACAVGATDFDDWCSSFSNWGTYVDIAAPGEGLKSTAYTGDQAYELDGAGTSFSCPLVAAAAGLVWSYRPELSLSEVRDALENHGGMAYNFALPLVRLDIKAALDSVVVPVTPTASGITITADSLYGAVPHKPSVSVALKQPVNVVRAQYTLDLPPYNDSSAADIEVQSTAAPDFAATLSVPVADNFEAQLRAEYFSSTDEAGTPIAARVYVFNQRGDVNCDGVVDLADLDAYALLLGVVQGTAGYSPFFDSDLDGVINEADASAVGYFFNGVLPYPVVQSVAPAGGYSGENVTYGATVSGQEPLSYAWDFGGGATPNTSSAVSPTVTLGAEGTYNASLTLSNVSSSDTYDFTLIVEPQPGMIALFAASPRTGSSPLWVTFDAAGSFSPNGNIVKYEWSWDGDTIWEYTTDTSDAFSEFIALGDHTVRLQVTDTSLQTAQATMTIHVVADPPLQTWASYELGFWGISDSRDNIHLVTDKCQNKSAVLWISEIGFTDQSLNLAIAKQNTPTSITDWNMHSLVQHTSIKDTLGLAENGQEIALAYCLNDEITYGEHNGTTFNSHAIVPVISCSFLDLAMIDGKPALFIDCSLIGETTSGYHYAYADQAHPTSANDWTIITLNDSNASILQSADFSIELIEVNGLPYVHGNGRVVHDTQRVFAFADTPTPVATNWYWYGLGNNEQGQDYGKLFMQNALPEMVIVDTNNYSGCISYAHAKVDHPAQASDWDSYNFYTGNNWLLRDAALIGLAQVILTRSRVGLHETDLWIAQNPSPGNPDDWLQVSLPYEVDDYNRRLVDHGGQPAMLAVIDGGGTDDWRLVYRYPVP